MPFGHTRLLSLTHHAEFATMWRAIAARLRTVQRMHQRSGTQARQTIMLHTLHCSNFLFMYHVKQTKLCAYIPNTYLIEDTCTQRRIKEMCQNAKMKD